jgi:NAD(P)-dependent dehydrogenase (short-subunit alcohol dehydrogenase family)
MNEKTAGAVADEIKAMGRKSLALQANVANSKQVDRVVREAVGEFGKIDILVNDVGGGTSAKRRTAATPPPTARRFVDIDEADWDATFELNVKTQFLMCRAVAPYMMEKRSGKIVNIGSWLGHRPGNIQLFAYSVAKGAVLHFTRLLATELAEYNINVNCVSPGDVLTPRIEQRFRERIEADPAFAGKTPGELFTDVIKTRTALQRLQTPEDMGRTVAFLASEDARNITGHIIFVDGGQVMP